MNAKRITLVAGHYGSGKTNIALWLSTMLCTCAGQGRL